ncbi:MAG: hypothetical protein JMDDDDMK_01050 [Acidobacteria bacterium]|nr:hypothetical protein [Acidobacteriota bacterium]
MREQNMKRTFAALTLTALALAASLTFGLMDRYSASAQQTTGIVRPKTNIYALNADNVIFVLAPGATSFTRLFRVTTTNGNLIGIDFRPADGLLYAVTDTGSVYTINLTSGAATLVSNITVNNAPARFSGGFQSLMDFNPVLSAIRLIGSNCQNYAVVNASGNLNAAAIQTSLSYAAGDVSAGKTPNVSAGAYTNNYVGAANTLFYGIDYDLDTFVTIQPATPGGSSATGGGVLQTLGRLVTPNGAPVNVSPTADIDIYSDGNGGNSLIGVSGRTLFTIDLAQINQSQALGTTQNVVTRGIAMPDAGGGFIDIAVALAASTPTPTPTPTPAPTPTPTPAPSPTPSAITLQAENATLGGGSKVATNHAGFTGTGFVDFADNVANSFVEFSINHTGPRTLTFRYANGSTVNRTCKITINGVSVGMLSFPPTGAWTTWKTTSLSVNLGTTSGNKAVRVTSTTNAGGPNLDKLNVQ